MKENVRKALLYNGDNDNDDDDDDDSHNAQCAHTSENANVKL